MERIKGYDHWKTIPPEQEPVTYCSSCGVPMYEGEYLYTIDDEKLCEDCLNDMYRRML